MAYAAANMKRILFALREDWIDPVRERLDHARYEASFRDFHEKPVFAYYDCIVPLHLKDYLPLWDCRWGAECLIPSKPVVAVTNDKPSFMRFLRDNGFAELAPYILDDDVRYPFIYKKRKDIAGINSHVIATAEARAEFETRIVPEQYFKQEYVGGRTEYTTHFLAVNGRSSFDSTVEFTFDCDPYVRGIRCSPAETRKIETPCREILHRILHALNYTGTCCFNYKLVGGIPKIFELNPRAGGSLRMDINPYLDAYVAALEARHTMASLWLHRVRRRVATPSPPRDGAAAAAAEERTA